LIEDHHDTLSPPLQTNKQTIVGFDYQSHLAVRSGKKIPNQHPFLGNRGRLKVLNATKLVVMSKRYPLNH
jgi:hypothetical protein